jgi:hypothetical protein
VASGWPAASAVDAATQSAKLIAAVGVVEGLGRTPATAAQAREILGVPVSRRRV